MRILLSRIGSTLLLLGLLVGPPIGLLGLGRWDLLWTIPWADLLTRPDDGSLLVLLLTAVGWAAWLVVAGCLLAEVGEVISRGRIHIRLPGLGWLQPALGALVVTSIGAALIAPVAAQAVPPPGPASEPTPTAPAAVPASPVATSVVPAQSGTGHLVHAGEDLWTLAEQYYGDGSRWRELVDANSTVVLDPMAELEAGTVLFIPGAPAATPPSTVPSVTSSVPSAPPSTVPSVTPGDVPTGDDPSVTPGDVPTTADPGTPASRADSGPSTPPTVVVERGDSLWAIARERFGDGRQWPRIYAANRATISDPDLIQPGWRLSMPPVDHAAPAPALAARTGPTSTGPTPQVPAGRPPAATAPTAKAPAAEAPPATAPTAKAPEAEAPALEAPPATAPTPVGSATTAPATARTSTAPAAAIRPARPATSPAGSRVSPAVPAPAVPASTTVAAAAPSAPISGHAGATAATAQPSGPTASPPTTPAATVVPSAAPDLARLVAGLAPGLALGVVGVLAARRRTQLLQRALGRRIPAPSPEAQRLEQALDLLGAEAPDEPGWPLPAPSAVVVGLDADGEPVLHDLEDAGFTGLSAVDEQVAADFLAGVVTSLTCAPWSANCQVTVVGPELAWAGALDDPRVRVVADAQQARRLLVRLVAERSGNAAGSPLPVLRSQPDLADAWDSEVFLFSRPLPASYWADLAAPIALGDLGIGVLGVVTAQEGASPGVLLKVDDQSATLTQRPGFTPLLLDEPARHGLIELFETTGSQETTAAPWWDPGHHPPNLALLPRPITQPRKEEAVDAPLTSPHPQLQLLGPIDLLGARGDLPSRAVKQCIEYCAWIHTHPGRTATAMAASLLVAEGTRRSNMSRLRAWLGEDEDGEPYLPDAYSGRIALHPGISSDWERFSLLVHGGVNLAGSEALREALELVKGAPLADAAPGQWHWAEELRTDMVSTIRDAGVVLGRRGLDQADLDLARWAASRALTAAPEDELLMGLRIRTEHRAGNRAEVERLVLHLTRSARAIGVDLSEETVVMLQEVMEGRARARHA